MDKEKIHLFSIVLAVAMGIYLACSVYYPGIMSPDSLGMYRDALSGYFPGEGKPPMTAFLWRIILKIVPGPFGPLLFQNVIFWGGLGIIVALCRLGPMTSMIIILAIGLFPTVFGLLGILWSDVLLAAVLTLSVGMSLLSQRFKSRIFIAAAVVTLWCGLSVRFNAFPAIIPLAAWTLVLYFTVTGQRTIRLRTFIYMLIPMLLTMMLLSVVFSRTVSQGPGGATKPLQFSLYHDLAGIAVYSGDLRMPSHVYQSLPNLTLDMIRAAYDPADVNLLIYTSKLWDSEAFITHKQGHFRELLRVWAGAIADHPGAYLQRRWDAFATILQIRGVYYPFHTGIDSNELGLRFVASPAYERLIQWLHNNRSLFFRGWFFGCLSVIIVIAGIRLRRWNAVAVCSSGLLYIAPYIVLTTGSDFRYIWWMIVSTLLGSLLLVYGKDYTPNSVSAHSSHPNT